MTEPFRSSRHDRPILVADWKDAEELAAWHMRTVLGITGTALTGSGTDAGLDVTGDGAAAQVKHYQGAVGSPDVQRLRGAAHGQTALFYALHGYTRAGVEAADATGLALFSYTVYGDVEPRNAAARSLVATSTGAAVEPEPELEEDLPLSVALARVTTTTEAQEYDLQVFVVAQLADVLIRASGLPGGLEDLDPDRSWTPGHELQEGVYALHEWSRLAPHRIRQEVREALLSVHPAEGWVQLIERWITECHECLVRSRIYRAANRFTLLSDFKADILRSVDEEIGQLWVWSRWLDRAGNASLDGGHSGQPTELSLLRDKDFWRGDDHWTHGQQSPASEERWMSAGDLEYARDYPWVLWPLLLTPPFGLSRGAVVDTLDEAGSSARYLSMRDAVEI